MKVLVTGGAGYIGSHVVRLLENRGDEVLIVDDFSNGLPARVADKHCVDFDLAGPGASDQLKKLLINNGIQAVIHFAARKRVGESVEKPELHYQQNVGGLANLLLAMRDAGTRRLVFSSSAATYGMPDVPLVTEDTLCQPINPYGQTKLIGEWMAANAGAAWGLRHSSLRYFNVAGAGWPDLADTAVTNLIPIVFAAIKAGQAPTVFGDDYATPDGSCVRDYVHVLDLAEAHLAALDYLDNETREQAVFNVGTGVGSSVFEVLAQIKKTSGIDFEIAVADRRAGDPPYLVGSVERIAATLAWKAKNGLAEIVESAWAAVK